MSWFSSTVAPIINKVAPIVNPISAPIQAATGLSPTSQYGIGAGVGSAGALLGSLAPAGAGAVAGAGSGSGIATALGLGAGSSALGSLLPGLAGAAAGAYGSDQMAKAMEDANATNVDLAHQQETFSAGQAQNEMNFQERMSDTSYQRSIADMKAAGINPLMAVGNGGASTPSGAMGSMSLPDVKPVPSVVAGSISSAVDMMNTYANLKKSFADADASSANADLARAKVPQVGADVTKTKADTAASIFESKFFNMFNGMFDRVKGAWDNAAPKYMPSVFDNTNKFFQEGGGQPPLPDN